MQNVNTAYKRSRREVFDGFPKAVTFSVRHDFILQISRIVSSLAGKTHQNSNGGQDELAK